MSTFRQDVHLGKKVPCIETPDLANGAITETRISDGAVTTAKLHDGAVTEQKVGSGAVTESKIGANAVTGQKIADGAVSTAKLGDGSVTNVKIVDGAVGNSKIKDGTIENGKLAGGITNDKLAGGITADKLAGGITNEQLAGGITGDKLAAGSVSEGKLVDGSVSEDKIVSGAVSEDKIADGAVTTDKLALGAISDDKIADGALLAFETEQSEKLEELEGKNATLEKKAFGELKYGFVKTGGYYLNNGGVESSTSEDWAKTDKVSMSEGDVLTVKSAMYSGVLLPIVAFSKDGEVVGYVQSTNSGGVVQTYTYEWQEGVAYAICCCDESLKSNCSCVVSRTGSLSSSINTINSQLTTLSDTVGGKIDKTSITTNVNEYNTNKVINEFGGVLISNPFSLNAKGFVNTSGMLIDYGGADNNYWWYSNYIPINTNTKNKVLNNLSSNVRIGLVGLAFYSSADQSTFIGYYKPDNDDATVQNETLFSVRIADAIASNSAFANAKYFTFTQRYMYNEPNVNSMINTATNGIAFANTGFIYEDGSTRNVAGYKVTDLIEIDDAVKSIVLKGLYSYSRAKVYPIAFYDADRNLIGTPYKAVGDNGTTQPLLCEINIGTLSAQYANASYFRACVSADYSYEVSNVAIEKSLESYNWRDKSWVLNQFGKVVFLGDSVTQGFVADSPIYDVVASAAYPAKIKNFIPAWNVTNLGRAGDSSLDCYSGGEGRPAIYPTHDFSNDELVVIEFGYNTSADHGGALVTTQINTEGTSAWAYDKIIKGIKQQNSSAEIVCVIPSCREIVKNWSAAIIAIAENNNCKYINLTEDNYIHLDANKWHGNDPDGNLDRVHFSKAGYNAKAFVVFNKLIELFS